MPALIVGDSYLDLVEAAHVVGLRPESLRRLVYYGQVRR